MTTDYDIEKRHFYRHPMSVPIALTTPEEKSDRESRSLDVSFGGLSFLWPSRLSAGSFVNVHIPVKDKLFEIKSRVAYSAEDGKTGRFRVGVCFADHPSAFMARFAEQTLEILRYHKDLCRELGHEVSEEEAANQWIEKYADKFPRLV